jgi:phospholipid/cholesterol/gamma-HCH transport system substrate-binding protein
LTQTPARDLAVGLFVLAGLLAIAYLSLSVGGLTLSRGDGYELYARFDAIGGLKPRAQVTIGGVRVGQVEAIDLSDDYRPRVRLRLERRLELPEDSSAEILTSGLLGDQYIELTPGGLEEMLRPGAEIAYTQNAFVLERTIGRLLQNLGQGDGGAKAPESEKVR